MTDPRTPVIVGVGQLTVSPSEVADLAAARDPVDLMGDAVRAAVRNASAGRNLLDQVQAVYIPQPLSRRYPDPGALLLQRLGITGATSFRALVGGNSPLLLLHEAGAAIQRGELDVAVIAGAESMHSRFRARREGVDLPWERSDLPECRNEVGDARPGTTDDENRHGAAIPIEIYPLFETAVRARLGRGIDDHQRAIGALWARFSAAASSNPRAWVRDRFSADDIVTPSADNRVVTFPYTKRMCANLSVDMAAAVVVTSLEAARAAGVPDERLVFPLAGADAHDHFFLSERWSLAESPAIRETGRRVLGAAGLTVDDVARFDLYSCFPSAVEVAMDALGITPADERPLTLTGGLAFFGGPGNNYVTHSLCEAVTACRAHPGTPGMVTGVGWYLTKHAATVLSTRPPDGGFVRVDPEACQSALDALPRRTPAGEHDGPVTIEATAVVYEREGVPKRATVTGLTDDGRRALAVSEDPDVTAAMVAEPWEGRVVKLCSATGRNVLEVTNPGLSPGS
ncbi:MAG: acetyl-CoA acetyltransferase [Actinobacteria bacterium]|nr:acetyl-CoA acetyltransferase [Actinomycetota bacterium]